METFQLRTIQPDFCVLVFDTNAHHTFTHTHAIMPLAYPYICVRSGSVPFYCHRVYGFEFYAREISHTHTLTHQRIGRKVTYACAHRALIKIRDTQLPWSAFIVTWASRQFLGALNRFEHSFSQTFFFSQRTNVCVSVCI